MPDRIVRLAAPGLTVEITVAVTVTDPLAIEQESAWLIVDVRNLLTQLEALEAEGRPAPTSIAVVRPLDRRPVNHEQARLAAGEAL